MTSTELDRRNFLSLTGKGLGLAAISSSTVGALLQKIHAATKTVAHLTPEQAAMDEDFWFEIQQAFTVTRGTTENISISSTPSGVEAMVSGLAPGRLVRTKIVGKSTRGRAATGRK